MNLRVDHWEVALAETARAMVGLPFEWGSTDCVCVVLKCLDAMCGTDAQSDVVGHYKTPEGAYRWQEQGNGLLDVLGRWGAEKVGCPCLSRRGDVLVGKRDRFISGHLVLGRQCLSSDPEAGVVLVDLVDVTKLHGITAWRY